MSMEALETSVKHAKTYFVAGLLTQVEYVHISMYTYVIGFKYVDIYPSLVEQVI